MSGSGVRVVKYVLTAVALLIATVAGTAESAGPSAHSASPMFRAGAELVALAVTVLDQKREHLAGLSAEDFVVLENGVEQPVSYFAASAAPIDVTLLVDASSSMGDKLEIVRDAVRRLTRSLRPIDRAAIVEFRETTLQRQPMTADRAAIDAAIGRLSASGGTALYTAIYVALSGLRSTSDGDIRRRAVVVFSDGEDTASLVGDEDVLDQARRSGVAVYVIALEAPSSRDGTMRRIGDGALTSDDRALQMLARESGGTAFFPAAVRELDGIFHAIAEELGRQYMIGFTPHAGGDGVWRPLRVRLPAYPRAQVRSRSGYYADDGRPLAISQLRRDPR
jgi:VWFA-related protein